MNPLSVINAAIKQVPAVKYALGVAGIAAAVSLVRMFIPEPEVAVPVLVLMFALMVLLLLFTRLDKVLSNTSFKLPAQVVLWVVVVLFSATLTVLFTTYFLSWPRPIDEVLSSKASSDLSFSGFFPFNDEVDVVAVRNLPIEEELENLLGGIRDSENTGPVLRLAIPDLSVRGGDEGTPVGGVIADVLRDYLNQNSKGFSLVDRKSLTLLSQIASSSNYTSDIDAIADAAAPSGADIVLAGIVSDLGNGSYVLRVAAIDVVQRLELAFQTCEKEANGTYLTVVSECLGPGLRATVAELNQRPKPAPVSPQRITENKRLMIAEARQLQYQGQLEAAQKIYAENLTRPSNDWQAEIDYLRLMNDLGAREWVQARSEKLLSLIPTDTDFFCYRAMVLNIQAGVTRGGVSARNAVRNAASCGDNAVVAQALLVYARSFDHIDLRASRAAINKAKALLPAKGNHFAWLKCELDHYDYVALHENEIDWQGNRSERFKSIAEQCLDAGNIYLASLAYRNAGVTAWSAEEGHEYVEKAVELARLMGGSSLDESLIRLADSYRVQGKYKLADQTIIDSLAHHVRAIEAITGGLPASLNALDADILARTGASGGIANTNLSENQQLMLEFHKRGASKAIVAWSERTKNYSTEQAATYRRLAATLDEDNGPKSTDLPLDEALKEAGFSFDDLAAARHPPLRGDNVDVEGAYNALRSQILSTEFDSLEATMQDQLFEIAEKLTNWRGSDIDLIRNLISQARVLTNRGQRQRSMDLLARAQQLIVDKPDLTIRLENARIQNFGDDQIKERIASRRKQTRLAEQYSAKEFVRMNYWLQRDLWSKAGKAEKEVVEDMLTSVLKLGESGAYDSITYGLGLLADLVDVVTNSDGTAETVRIYRIRELVLRNIGDQIGAAMAAADVVNAQRNYLAHRFRGSLEEQIEDDPLVEHMMATLLKEINQLAAEGLKRDAVRIVTRIPVEVPEMVELVPDALKWIESIAGSTEYFNLASTLHRDSATFTDSIDEQVFHLEKSRDIALSGKDFEEAVRSEAKITYLQVKRQKSYLSSFDNCISISKSANHRRFCVNGVWHAHINEGGQTMVNDVALRRVYEEGLALIEEYDSVSWTPLSQIKLFGAVGTMAIILGERAVFDSFHQQVFEYYTITEPNDYQWSTHLSRVANSVKEADPRLSLELFEQFMGSDGASDYWRSGAYLTIAKLARSLEESELYSRAYEEGILAARNKNRRFVPYYTLLGIAPAVAAEDWEQAKNIYLNAADEIKRYRPQSDLWAQEMVYMAARCTAHQGEYHEALQMINQQVITAQEQAAGERKERPCYLAGILKFAQSVQLALGNCGEAEEVAQSITQLHSSCDGTFKKDSWSDSKIYNNWVVNNTCGAPIQISPEMLLYQD